MVLRSVLSRKANEKNETRRDGEDQTTKLTLTTLSQPAETMTGLAGLGENRTHETLDATVIVRQPGSNSLSVSLSLSTRSTRLDTSTHHSE